MPKIDSLDRAGELLARVSADLKAAGDAVFNPPKKWRETENVEAVYGMLAVLGRQLRTTAEDLAKVAAQLRNAAAELENLDEK